YDPLDLGLPGGVDEPLRDYPVEDQVGRARVVHLLDELAYREAALLAEVLIEEHRLERPVYGREDLLHLIDDRRRNGGGLRPFLLRPRRPLISLVTLDPRGPFVPALALGPLRALVPFGPLRPLAPRLPWVAARKLAP